MTIGASDADIDNFIASMGLKSVYNALEDDQRLHFYNKVRELQIKKDFRDLRFGELSDLNEFHKVYRVKDFNTLTTLEYRSLMKFFYHMMFSGRIIKLYENEYEQIPQDIRTILVEDVDFHDKLKESMVVND